MSAILWHRHAGILSAFGLALADTVTEAQVPSAKIYCEENCDYFQAELEKLEQQCRAKLESEGFSRDNIRCEAFLNLRYDTTDTALMCPPVEPQDYEAISEDGLLDTEEKAKRRKKELIEVPRYGAFGRVFYHRYMREFGFLLDDRDLIVDDIRVRAVGMSGVSMQNDVPKAVGEPPVLETVKVFASKGRLPTPVYKLDDLRTGHSLRGPVVILNDISTFYVEPDWVASVLSSGDVRIDRTAATEDQVEIPDGMDPIHLSIFGHRFMSIAEQMGRVLQRTSISTNIKERLDFSCAIFGPSGKLVSNAPHIPVHLGAMQMTVEYQLRHNEGTLRDGDTLLSNHPCAGGSHLPDLTVVTPVFYKGGEKPSFFLASRGHHADIGGITPGSMPPHSYSITQEGAIFHSFKLVEGGVFQLEKLVEHLEAPAKIPGSSGSRNIRDNVSDLKAQVAANMKGIALVTELIEEYSLRVVHNYMDYIQTSAEIATRNMFKQLGEKRVKWQGRDQMDDGSIIQLTVNISPTTGEAHFDFSGTSEEMHGNSNAPISITYAAIIYCIRCMLGVDTPLNHGLLVPISVDLPTPCLLNPSPEAAVVGGNVTTSQRVVDVIFRALEVCAASQGCMNNVTFGDASLGYYETVAGGAGAGPSWAGRSGVHTHMTNTRITDPEILELRYPVLLRSFCLRQNTGGLGLFRGGDGVQRVLEFRRPSTLSVITERRVLPPYGMAGGSDGGLGVNLFKKAGGGRVVRLPSKISLAVEAGDEFHLLTPGGGGYGQHQKTFLEH